MKPSAVPRALALLIFVAGLGSGIVQTAAGQEGAALVAMFSAPLEAQDLDQLCSGKLVAFPLPSFQAFDTDGNGAIDKREARDCRSLGEVFEELDLDDDHELDQPEYNAFSTIWTERAETFGVDE